MSSDQTPDSPHGDADATDPPAWVLGCTCGAEQDAAPATESTPSPHRDADATDPTLVLADRLHQIIREAGFDCPEDECTPLCWEIAQRLVIDSGAVRHEFVSRLGGAEAACTCGAAHFGVVNHAEAREWWEAHLVERRAARGAGTSPDPDALAVWLYERLGSDSRSWDELPNENPSPSPSRRACREYWRRLVADMPRTGAPEAATPDPVAAVLALADALDREAHDRAAGASVERRATKIQVAARIRRALGVEGSDGRD